MLALVLGIETDRRWLPSPADDAGHRLFYVSMWFGFVDTFEIASPAPLRTATMDDGAADALIPPRRGETGRGGFGFNPGSRFARPNGTPE